MKKRNLLYMLAVLLLISCGNQNTENKRQKLSPKELYKRKVDATCTIITDLGQGSGFFVDSNIIVTNYHVISDAKTANVVLNNEANKYEILGYLAIDKINDIALLLVNYKSQNILKIENDIPSPGDHVFSISTPIGLSKTFSDGLISGKKNFDGRTLIQITVPISHGSSGCPIMNEYGDIVGIAVGGIEEGNNLNFCIPTSYLLNLLEFKESYPTSLNTVPEQRKTLHNDKPKSNKIPNSKNSEITKPKNQLAESRKSILMKSSEVISGDYLKKELTNTFYNDKKMSFLHKGNWNIDYNTVQFFMYEKSSLYQSPLYKTLHCIKYVITFTRTLDNKKFYEQYFIDDSFRAVDSWGTYDEKDKHINYWAWARKEEYGKSCE
jgi:hypothetical protein